MWNWGLKLTSDFLPQIMAVASSCLRRKVASEVVAAHWASGSSFDGSQTGLGPLACPLEVGSDCSCWLALVGTGRSRPCCCPGAGDCSSWAGAGARAVAGTSMRFGPAGCWSSGISLTVHQLSGLRTFASIAGLRGIGLPGRPLLRNWALCPIASCSSSFHLQSLAPSCQYLDSNWHLDSGNCSANFADLRKLKRHSSGWFSGNPAHCSKGVASKIGPRHCPGWMP